jgi:hypothetical protein
MFNLFKNKQKDQFDKYFYQFTEELTQLIQQSKTNQVQNDDETFVETADRYVFEFNELFWRLDKLELKIESTLKPLTTEQEVEKIDLVRNIYRAQTKLLDSINYFKSLKNAYLQGLRDGHNLERD